jgi:hypothetical protein
LGFFGRYIDFYYPAYHPINRNSSFFRPKLRLEFDERNKQNDYAPSAACRGILEIRKDGVYFDGSNTTNRMLDVLEKGRPKIICIDELDKMGRTVQNQMLNFLESGRVDIEQQKKQYHFQIKGSTQLNPNIGLRTSGTRSISGFVLLY